MYQNNIFLIFLKLFLKSTHQNDSKYKKLLIFNPKKLIFFKTNCPTLMPIDLQMLLPDGVEIVTTRPSFSNGISWFRSNFCLSSQPLFFSLFSSHFSLSSLLLDALFGKEYQGGLSIFFLMLYLVLIF